MTVKVMNEVWFKNYSYSNARIILTLLLESEYFKESLKATQQFLANLNSIDLDPYYPKLFEICRMFAR